MNPDFVAQSQPSTVLSGIVAWNIGPSTRSALVTTAIGGDYFNDFLRFSFPYWEKYAETHGIGIIALTDLNAFGRDTRGMNGAWLKLLAPEVVALHFPKVERLALVDTDVIMSPSAPDIFGAAPDNQIAVVSEYENLPYPLVDVKKRMESELKLSEKAIKTIFSNVEDIRPRLPNYGHRSFHDVVFG